MDSVKRKTDGALDINTLCWHTTFLKFTQVESEKVGLAVFVKTSILIYVTSDDLRLNLVCLFWVDIEVTDNWVFVDRVCRRIMLVKVLCVVHNDKLHLFQLVNSVWVACHRTSILTLGYFKNKLSECVMAIVVVTTKTDIFTAFLGVNLWVCYATSNELIWLLSWTSDLNVGSFIETLHWLPLLEVIEFAYWALSRAIEIVEICSWAGIKFE